MMFFSSPLVSGLKMTGWFRCKQRAIVLNKDRLLGWHRPLVFCERKKPSCARIPHPTTHWGCLHWCLDGCCHQRRDLPCFFCRNGQRLRFRVSGAFVHCSPESRLPPRRWCKEVAFAAPRISFDVESDLYHKTSMFLACGCIWVKSTNWEVQCSKARRVNIEFSRSPNRLLRPWPFGQAWRCCMAHLSQTKATLKSLPVNETLQLSSWTYGDAVFDKY